MRSGTGKLAFDPPALMAEAIAMDAVAISSDSVQRREPAMLGRLRRRLCPDEELAEQLRSGAGDALAELFRRHGKVVYTVTWRILRNTAEAEDAAQQAFLDAYRAIGQFDAAKGSFKAWLLMFAHHRAFNHRRSLTASRFFESDPFEGALLQVQGAARQVQGLSDADRRILVRQALKMLPARQRRTIELTYFGGLTADEVAERTGETVRVVRHNLYRGLEKLRKVICDPEQEPDRQGNGVRR